MALPGAGGEGDRRGDRSIRWRHSGCVRKGAGPGEPRGKEESGLSANIIKIITPELKRRAQGTPRAKRVREEETRPVAAALTNTEVLGCARGTPACPKRRERDALFFSGGTEHESKRVVFWNIPEAGGGRDLAPGPPRLWLLFTREGGPTKAQNTWNTCRGYTTRPAEPEALEERAHEAAAGWRGAGDGACVAAPATTATRNHGSSGVTEPG